MHFFLPMVSSLILEWCKNAIEEDNKIIYFEKILSEISKDSDLSKIVWESEYFPLLILQIFSDSFYILNTKNFHGDESDKVRLCIDILQIICENKELRHNVLEMKMDYYLYPFLIVPTDEKLRISTLKLFCTILDDGNLDNLKESEILPILLRSVDFGSHEQQELSLTALQHILMGKGLDYAVQTFDRFQAIDIVLSSMITKSIYSSNIRSLKKLISIYIRLCDKVNVIQKIREKMPEGIDSKEILNLCNEDEELDNLRKTFMNIVSDKKK